MKRSLLVGVVVMLLGCEDSGPAPFTGKELFNGGGKPGAGGSGGGKGGSGGSGGSSGSSGGSSCYGQCGSSSAQPSGCYCDSQCPSNSDCCTDYYQYCGAAGSGGSAGACSSGQYDPCSTNDQCCGYPDSTLCVNFGTDGTYCTPRCVGPSECSSGCCIATQQGNYVCHPASACN